MARKKSTDLVIPAVEARLDDIIVLDNGQTARIVDMGTIMHTVTQEVPVKVLSYELCDGEWGGYRTSSSMIGNEELTIKARPEDKSWWWRMVNRFRW